MLAVGSDRSFAKRLLSPRLRLVFWLIVAAVVHTSEASAYCWLTDCKDDPATGKVCSRESGCITEGIRLYPRSSCFQFAIAEGHGELVGLSDYELDSIIQRAFQRWQSVDCGQGRRPGFRVQSAGVVPAQEAFSCNYRDLNTDVWVLKANWDPADSALGYTLNTHAENDGEIFDSDVELNLLKLVTEVPFDQLEAALLSVATHEAGHVLGLGHSNDFDAVMAASYGTPEHVRELTPDDIEGICRMYPSDPKHLECAEPAVIEAGIDAQVCRDAKQNRRVLLATTCALSTSSSARGGFGASSIGAGVLCVVLFWRRRRRAQAYKLSDIVRDTN